MLYFGHDTDAHMDEKCLVLFGKYGAEGYGIYWIINERIGRKIDANKLNCKLHDTPEIISSLSRVPVDRIREVMDFMASKACGLLVKNDEQEFFNPGMKRRLDEYTKRKKRADK